jgi:1,4-alpha-glucan branching enzyme
MDKHSFYIGQSFDAYDYFGAHIENGKTIFRTYAPNATKICVIGDFNDWQEEEMYTDGNSGIYEFQSDKAKENMLYKYVIYTPHSRCEHCDPYGFSMELRPDFASRITNLEYKFSDENWLNNRNRCYDSALNIYEMHLGSWKTNKDDENGWYKYDELIPLLIPYLKENGYTYVEFMPLSEHPFDGSWGYQNTGFFAPTSRYGTPVQLKKLIDALHKENIGAIIDIVPVHFACDSYGLKSYDGTPLYEHPAMDVGNSEWGTCNFAYSRGEVCSFLQSNANYWISEYHFDGIRMDAISRAIYWSGNPDKGINDEAVRFLKNMNAGLHRIHPDIFLCAEDSTAFANVTKPASEGGLDFDYKWDMGWMNDTLDFFRSFPWERKNIANKLTFSMMYFYSERFILPFSHDENVHGKATIVQKMNGDYDDKFPQARALYMYMYMHPGKKLNFMGNEFGQLREWTEEQEQDWSILSYPIHDDFRRYISDLNKIYLRYDALHYDYNPLNFNWVDLPEKNDSCIFSISRHSGNYDILAIFNFDGSDKENYSINIKGKAKLLLCSEHINENKLFKQEKLENGEYKLTVNALKFSATMFYIEK